MSRMHCFIDTSAWYALLIATDPHHDCVRAEYLRFYTEGMNLVTSNLVLGELYTLLSARRESLTGYWAFHDKLLKATRIRTHPFQPEHIAAAFALLRNRPDKTYSFVDATSFVLMQDEHIPTALTLDRHFGQEGFQVLSGTPAPPNYAPGISGPGIVRSSSPLKRMIAGMLCQPSRLHAS